MRKSPIILVLFFAGILFSQSKDDISPNTVESIIDSVVHYYKLGAESSNNGHFNKSLSFIAKALKENPKNSTAYYYAGLIRKRFGENEKARINFERAVSDSLLGYNAHFYLGEIYGNIKQYQKAIDNLEVYISKTDYAQGKLEAQNLINNYKIILEDKSPAKNNAEKELPIFNNREQLKDTDYETVKEYYRLADLHYKRKKWKEAYNFYVKATELYSNYSDTPWGLYQIANILHYLNKYEESIDAYDLLQDKFPESFWAKQSEFRRNILLNLLF